MHPAVAPSPHAGPPLSRQLLATAEVVRAVTSQGRSLADLLPALPPALRPGVQALTFHALRWWGSAGALRALLAPRRPPPAVDALLTTALALLWPEGGLPYAEHTLVDQTVAATRKLAAPSAGFVNAVLRRLLRERDALIAQAQATPAGAFNHPDWWVRQLREDWPEQWQALLAAANQRAPMVLRVNRRRGSVEQYLQRLQQAGIAARAAPAGLGAAAAVVLEQPVPVTALPGFAEGDCSVQDLAAMQAAPLLLGTGLPAGARVLDACAAPGGKTAHLLELAELELMALDVDATRLQRVRDNLQRLHLQAELIAADASQPTRWWDGRPFDAILLDAPCSASGIVRRHPDVRWLRRAADIPRLAATQLQLLQALWPLLRPGGRLLFATCSIFRSEGQAVIDAFLQREDLAGGASQCAAPGHLLPLADNAAHPAQPVPDGFFYALLEKAAP